MSPSPYKVSADELRALRAAMWYGISLQWVELGKQAMVRGDYGTAFVRTTTGVGVLINLTRNDCCVPSTFKRGGITRTVRGGEPIIPGNFDLRRLVDIRTKLETLMRSYRRFPRIKWWQRVALWFVKEQRHTEDDGATLIYKRFRDRIYILKEIAP